MSSGAALSPSFAALLLFGGFFLLMALRVPIAFALGLACLPVMVIEPRLSPMILFNETFKSYNSFILLAVPTQKSATPASLPVSSSASCSCRPLISR